MTENRFEGLKRAYWITSQAYYHGRGGINFLRDAKEEIWLSYISEDGGGEGEIFFRFYDLHSGSHLTPKLEVFDESWPHLLSMTDLLQWLGERGGIGFTPDELVQQLNDWGFEDMTQRVDPNAEEVTFIITDGCDDLGRGQFELTVNTIQLTKMLNAGVVYEDTISDYVGRHSNDRRHFHPAHQDGKSAVDVMVMFHDMQCGKYGDEYR